MPFPLKYPLLLVVVALLSGFASAAAEPLDVKESFLHFTGHAFLHDFHGQAQDFSGSAQINPMNPKYITGARLEISTARMTTFEDTRDRNMRDWLHPNLNPQITFRLINVSRLKGDPRGATRAHPALFSVQSDLTLNKTTRPFETQVSGWREGRFLIVTGATPIDTVAYGLPIIKQFFMTVNRDVDVNFRLVFDLPPDLQISPAN